MSDNRIFRHSLLAVACSGLALLAACGHSETSQVTRLHDADLPETGTIAIRPASLMDDRDRHFSEYAAMIANKFREAGYRIVDDTSDADMIAFVQYDVNGEYRDWQRYWAAPYRGYWFPRGIYTPYNYVWDDRFYDFHGPSTVYLADEIRYARSLEIDLVSPRPGPDETIFEGRAISLGRRDDMQQVMPYLVAAMFTDFPGESDTTKVISIEDDGIARPDGNKGYR